MFYNFIKRISLILEVHKESWLYLIKMVEINFYLWNKYKNSIVINIRE